MEDGDNDLNNLHGDWLLANHQMSNIWRPADDRPGTAADLGGLYHEPPGSVLGGGPTSPRDPCL
jgi:hypothetical protein